MFRSARRYCRPPRPTITTHKRLSHPSGSCAIWRAYSGRSTGCSLSPRRPLSVAGVGVLRSRMLASRSPAAHQVVAALTAALRAVGAEVDGSGPGEYPWRRMRRSAHRRWRAGLCSHCTITIDQLIQITLLRQHRSPHCFAAPMRAHPLNEPTMR